MAAKCPRRATVLLPAILLLSQLACAAPCPGGRKPLRAAAIHTQSDYALACTDESGAKDGPYEERFNDGTVAAIGQYRKDQQEETWTFPFRKGGTMSRGVFRAGRKDGEWTSYYENGRKLEQGPYREDALDGTWRAWYESGARQSEGGYRNGEKTGRWTYWFANGQPDRTGEYRGTRLLPVRNAPVPAEWGKWTYWYLNGGKRAEGCFQGGEQIGLWTEWSPEGRVVSREDHGSAGQDAACR